MDKINQDDKLRYATLQSAWTNTFSGKVCLPLLPEETTYNIVDIAHSLGMQCRWNGHVKRFLSVGQHCCYAHDFVKDKSAKKQALLHDATESALSDVARPIKGFLTGYVELEHRTETSLYRQFNIVPTEATTKSVKEIDTLLLIRERALLINKADREWGFEGIDTSYIDEMLPTIPSWSPAKAKKEFLKRFWSLDALSS